MITHVLAARYRRPITTARVEPGTTVHPGTLLGQFRGTPVYAPVHGTVAAVEPAPDAGADKTRHAVIETAADPGEASAPRPRPRPASADALREASRDGGLVGMGGAGFHLGRGDPERTRTWGRRAARQLRELGLHVNLGPVLDVGQDGHLARQFRLFSDDPDRVVAHARAYVEGLASEGIPAIVKHYPGFGRAETDSDHVSTVIDASAHALTTDRALFGRVPAAGIMLANATYPALDPSPAPLSAAIVADARAHTGGVVVTDDLARLGRSFIDEDVLRGAFLAGADLLVTSVRLDGVLPVFRRVVGELLAERPALWERVEASGARIAELRRSAVR